MSVTQLNIVAMGLVCVLMGYVIGYSQKKEPHEIFVEKPFHSAPHLFNYAPYSEPLKMWALREIAHGDPVIMNVAISQAKIPECADVGVYFSDFNNGFFADSIVYDTNCLKIENAYGWREGEGL